MEMSRSIVSILMATLAALTLSACGDSNKTAGQQLDSMVAVAKEQTGKAMDTATVAAHEAGSGLKSAAGSTEKVMDDAAITASVKASIVREPGLSATAIEVSTSKGVVTLKGNVDDEMSRKNAIQLATGTEGVRGVTDQLTVRKS